jgi:histidinol-phosphate aminotransferase
MQSKRGLKMVKTSNNCIKAKLQKLQGIESYKLGESTEKLAKQLGILPNEIIKLNFNENLFLPKVALTDIIKQVAEQCDLRIYPQEEQNKLKESLSKHLKIPYDTIVVGNASDELIDRISRMFLEKGETAVSINPTFPIFKYCAKRQGANYLTIPLLKNLRLDVEKILKSFSPKTSLLYLCSPNNPTGTQFCKSEILPLINEFPGIVVLDEAYGEYANYSMVSKVDEFDNLIILRTFSKAFGLAALRLGYAVTNSTLAKTLSEKSPLPFPVSSFTLNMGKKLLETFSLVAKSVEELKKERGKLITQLNKVNGIRAFDSQANFVFFTVDKPYELVYQNLLSKGLLIKKLGKILHLDNCFRTTVGLPWMNERLIENLKKILSD